MEGCKQTRTLETAQWLNEHKGHGEPSTMPYEHQPPKGTYSLRVHVCPCGARHIFIEPISEGRP